MYHKYDSSAREQVGALFSGLPKALRDNGHLIVLQAWFDESGKGQEPVYLLAGYIGRKAMWESLADDWQAELDREPKLPYLHANESQLFKGCSPLERENRLLRFVEIIRKHKPLGMTLMLKHSDYRQFFQVLSAHPIITAGEKRMLRNPYFLSFQIILNVALMRQAKKRRDTGVVELVEVLFDEDVDRKSRLETGFNNFVKTVQRNNPSFLDLLINKTAEFRDDKCFMPLQAADLLAWHFRRFAFEVWRGNPTWTTPIWTSLQDGIENQILRYTEKEWLDVLMRINKTWQEIRRGGKLS